MLDIEEVSMSNMSKQYMKVAKENEGQLLKYLVPIRSSVKGAVLFWNKSNNKNNIISLV